MYADENGNIIDDDEEFKISQENEESKEGAGTNVQWEQPNFSADQEEARISMVSLTEGSEGAEIRDEEIENQQ